MLRRSHDHHRGLRARCHATASADSTPHDRVSSPQICLSRSLPLDWPRQSALRFPADISNRPTVHDVRRDPPLIHEPLHRRTTCWIGSPPITHLARDSQISIAPAARFYLPPARFPPLQAFGRRPPNTRRRPSSGRHPKPFTLPDVAPCGGMSALPPGADIVRLSRHVR